MSEHVYRKILLVMAMEYEARPLLDALGARWDQQPRPVELEPPLPMRYWGYAGPAGGEVFVTVNGADPKFGVDNVATQPATLATHVGIRRLAPDLVMTVGTAGALPDTATIGRVFHIEGFRFHDRRIFGIEGTRFDEYGSYAQAATALPDPVDSAPVPKAIVSTGNSLNPVIQDIDMMRENGAILKDMEGAAVAWVAGLYGLPCAGVKAVTNVYQASDIASLCHGQSLRDGGDDLCREYRADDDRAGDERQVGNEVEGDQGGGSEAQQFQRNFELATNALAAHVPPLLERLLGSA